MRQEQLPVGWTELQVSDLATRYDEITDDQLAAEIEKAPESEISAEEAKAWLVSFSRGPVANNCAFAAKIVDKLSDNDVLSLFREARMLLSDSLKQAS